MFLLMFFRFVSFAQGVNVNYDSTLAKKLGADEYGMRKFVLVILKTGENKTEDRALKDSLFQGHMQNIVQMANQRKLIVAGPMAKNIQSYRGIFILNVNTIEEAKELLKQDPAVTQHLLEPEYFIWHGSAALPEYLSSHDKIWKKNP